MAVGKWEFWDVLSSVHDLWRPFERENSESISRCKLASINPKLDKFFFISPLSNRQWKKVGWAERAWTAGDTGYHHQLVEKNCPFFDACPAGIYSLAYKYARIFCLTLHQTQLQPPLCFIHSSHHVKQLRLALRGWPWAAISCCFSSLFWASFLPSPWLSTRWDLASSVVELNGYFRWFVLLINYVVVAFELGAGQGIWGAWPRCVPSQQGRTGQSQELP
jgi:hypothetical protein